MADQKVGLARKTKPVDGRPTVVGEVVVTVIKGEGVETRSKPTEAGDVVVRNRCPETGNEEYVVKAAKMKDRYGDPKGTPDAAGWVEYEPKGVEMRYFLLGEKDGPWSFRLPGAKPWWPRPATRSFRIQAIPRTRTALRAPRSAAPTISSRHRDHYSVRCQPCGNRRSCGVKRAL